MKKIAFITGITGQDGSYLAELLLEKNYVVYGIVRRTSLLFSHDRLDIIRNKIILRYGDLTDTSALSNYIRDILYKHRNLDRLEIYNLAAQSHVKASFEIPEYTGQVDGMGVVGLLEIIRSVEPVMRNKIRFYQAGTSEMYGAVLETPQDENTPFNPVSPYAAAKMYAHNMVKIYRSGYELYAVNGILFNHESPRRGPNFLTMKVVNGVKSILAGEKEFIQLGNLDSQRDWGHSKDYVKGMWQMLQQDTPVDYVLATGKTWKVREFVEKAFAYKGIALQWRGTGLEEHAVDQDHTVRVVVDPKYYRPCEVELLLGDATKAEVDLGWRREYDTVDKIIEDMFDGK